MTAQNFISKLKSRAWEIKKIIFFDSAFNMLILFLASFIILSRIISNYAVIISIILALAVAFVFFLKKTESYDVLKTISEKYPNFEESLKTAYDNKDKIGDNIIINSLMRDAANELSSISTAEFFNRKSITLKVFLIIFLSFSLLSVTFIEEAIAADKIIHGYGDSTGAKDNDARSEKEDENYEEENRNITGNKTDLMASGVVPLEIKAYYSERAGELEYTGESSSGEETLPTSSTGERKEYKEDEILKDDPVLNEAIKGRYNRTGE